MLYLTYFVFGYLAIAVGYYLTFSIASRFTRKKMTSPTSTVYHSIAVFIPAYREDAIIFDTAAKALRQQYPADRYMVYVIADSLKQDTLDQLHNLPVKVVEVSFEKSTKARAINKAYEQISEEYDLVVVLDADNVMASDYLTKVNEAYNSGVVVMQGHRVAKNEDSHMALLDAISEEINNRIFRKGHRMLGLSSALIGSGMAFDFQLFKEYMRRIDAIGGFDKELELSLLKDQVTIEYLEDAYVYDEKVSNAEVFTNQRTRWIAAQIRYGLGSFGKALLQLVKTGNVDYFDKSLQFLLPPRLILLGILVLLAAVTSGFQVYNWEIFTGLMSTYSLALILAVPARFFTRKTLRACLQLPKTFFLMLYAIGGYKKAKTNFLHTPHSTN